MPKPKEQNSDSGKRQAQFTPPSELILQGSMDGFSIIGPKGKFLKVNSALSDITGYSRDELLKMSLADLEVSETPQQIAEHIEKLTIQGYDRFETKHRHKDGRIIDIEVSAQLCSTDHGKIISSFFRDITEQNLNRQKLTHSEDIYRRAIEASAAVPYQMRLSDRKHIFIGEGIEKLTGIKAENFNENDFIKLVDEVIITHPNPSQPMLEAYHHFNTGNLDMFRTRLAEHHRQVADGKVTTFHADIHIHTTDGREKWLSDNVVYICDKDSGQLYSIGILQDITERKSAEQSIAHSEAIYRKAIEVANCVTYRLRLFERTFTFISPEIKQLTGLTAEDITATKFEDLASEIICIHPNPSKNFLEYCNAFNEKNYKLAKAKIDAYHQEVLAGSVNTYHVDFHIQTPDGREKWISNHALYNRDEKTGVFYSLGILQDITERKFAEQTIANSEAIYRKAIEVANGVTYQLNLFERTFTFISPGIEHLTGLSADQITATKFEYLASEIICTHPNPSSNFIEYCTAFNEKNTKLTKEKMAAYHQEVIAGSVNTYHADFRINTPDGREKWISNHAVYSRNEKTGVFFSLGIFQDITQRKRLEAELETNREKLFEAQKYAYIDSMTAAVAHQVNQPLTMINMLLGQTIEQIEKKSSKTEDILENLISVLNESKNAASVISAFRKHTRDNNFDIYSSSEIYKIAPKIISSLSEKARNARMNITMAPMFHLPPAQLNDGALEQVLLNIIQNAIEAADGKYPHTLTINATTEDGQIHLTIADDCYGIPPENLKKIFEPFFTTKAPEKGLGLGLEIVHRILIACGGQIRVKSEIGRGTAFFLTIPASNKHS